MNYGLAKKARREIAAMMGDAPEIAFGKSGNTPQFIEEVLRRLEKKEFLKVRILQRYEERQELEETIAKVAGDAGAEIVEVRGRTFILYKPIASSQP